MEEEIFVRTAQGLTDEHDVIVYLLGYDAEEELIADILTSSPECIRGLETALGRLGAAALYYRQKCSLVLKEYYGGSTHTKSSSTRSTLDEMYQRMACPLTTDSIHQSEYSPEHAGLRHDTSTSSESTSVCSQNSTKSTNHNGTSLTTDSGMN